MSNIHPSAIIEEGAIIGKNCIIEPFVYIGSDVKIGSNNFIGKSTYITSDVTIGDNNEIGQNSVIGTKPQSISYNNEPTKVVIGSNNVIRENVEIHRGSQVEGYGTTSIGDNNYIMTRVHFAHDCKIGSNIIIATSSIFGGHVEIGDRANVGAMSAVHQFCKIGRFAMIGGGSALTQDAPPFCITEGNRAKLRGLNAVGIRRQISRDAVNMLKPVYKKLFRSSVSVKEMAKDISEENDNELIKELCEFVLASKRGIPLNLIKSSKNEE